MLSIVLIKPRNANSYHENPPNRILTRFSGLNSVENKMQLKQGSILFLFQSHLGLTNLKEMGANSLIWGIFFKLGAMGENVLVEFEKKKFNWGHFF